MKPIPILAILLAGCCFGAAAVTAPAQGAAACAIMGVVFVALACIEGRIGP